MSEPRKAVCWLTDLEDDIYDNFTLAKMFLEARLHVVDLYFMLLRRKTSFLDRPITTASSGQRRWNAYDAYTPKAVEMLTEVYRVYYNFVKKGDDGQAPSMRLGVAKGPVKIEDILYYKESSPNLFK